MKKTILGQYRSKAKALFLLLAFGVFLFGKVDFTFALTKTTISTGLSAAVGVALDEAKNHLYFVEYGTGELNRIDLSNPSYPISLVASGFSHPEDVQLDLVHGFAYVTTRDAPGTGALWRVDISTGSKSLVTFNLGAPQQLVLDISNDRAFTVGYNDGRLRCISLTTGLKTPIVKGLGHPVGLAVTADGLYAYVTEQDAPARVSKIDLTLGVKIGNVIEHGTGGVSLVAPFFLAWADISQNSLYLVERDPVNRVSRVELTTSTKYEVITGLPWRPSGIAVNKAGTSVYITTDSQIVKVDLVELTGPIFMGVGHVPATEIDDQGYATTDSGYFFKVKNAPFGGTLNFFLNLEKFRSWGASHYELKISNGGAPVPISNISWQTYKWDVTEKKYKPFVMSPDPDDVQHSKYAIPIDSGIYDASLWYPPFFAMRWPSSNNGVYTFEVALYQKVGTSFSLIPIPSNMLSPVNLNELTLRIDNTPPVVNIHNIYQNKPPVTNIEPCVIVDSGNNEFTFKITANDAEGHLYSYSLSALYGKNQHLSITSDSYENHISSPPPPYVPVLWNGVVNEIVPIPPKNAPCNCAYTFYLKAWGRTINGYNRIQYVAYHKSITINLPSLSICNLP